MYMIANQSMHIQTYPAFYSNIFYGDPWVWDQLKSSSFLSTFSLPFVVFVHLQTVWRKNHRIIAQALGFPPKILETSNPSSLLRSISRNALLWFSDNNCEKRHCFNNEHFTTHLFITSRNLEKTAIPPASEQSHLIYIYTYTYSSS